MLTSFVAAALAAVLAGSATQSSTAQTAQTAQAAQPGPGGLALTLPGGTWCLGEPAGVPCDHVLLRASRPAPKNTDRQSWHFTLLDRTVCVGEVPQDIACSMRLDPDTLTRMKPS
jgi:hypothetical protein